MISKSSRKHKQTIEVRDNFFRMRSFCKCWAHSQWSVRYAVAGCGSTLVVCTGH